MIERQIYSYEVELSVPGKGTVVSFQNAYSVIDAMMQAMATSGASGDVKVVRVGPPQSEILKQERQIAAEIERMMRAAKERV